MSDFDNDNYMPTESLDEMEARHDSERKELEAIIKADLKGAKKGNRAVVEAQCIQRQYDLKAKHSEEMELLTEYIGLHTFN